MRAEPAGTFWTPTSESPAFDAEGLHSAATRPREPVHLLRHPTTGQLGVGQAGRLGARGDYPWLGSLPAVYPEWLGDRSFTQAHGLRFPYVAGAMANGITTSDMVVAMAKAGMIGFFGAAGQSVARIGEGLDRILAGLGGADLPWGTNLIHAPNEPEVERGTVELYLQRKARRVSASAYMSLTPFVVKYAYRGVRRLPDGSIHRDNYLFAKISRPEVARRFLSPAPAEMLDELVRRGDLTAEEAALARTLPVAEDITVEADSGGHTDNRPLPALFPTIFQLRDECARTFGYTRPIRVGAAGGLGTPSAVAAAFGLGAAYVLTGSVNQSALESGLAPEGKKLLATAGIADVTMAPAADMFELGVTVQVLQRGTLFANRARKLYELYQTLPSLDALDAAGRARLEREMFQMPLDAVWARCESFFAERNPEELARAANDPKHKMALIFRWYLGLSSKWAIAGDPARRMDYQIWCGPAMGAFNAWVKGSSLEPLENRRVVEIALNLLEGAAQVTRAQQLRSLGLPVPASAFHFSPRPLS